MTVYIHSVQLLYVSAPKVACTSVKEALFEVENGFPFLSYHANGSHRHIHSTSIYPALPFKKIPHDSVRSYLKFALVRHPIKRFLSAFSNRVVHYKTLSERNIGAAASQAGVPTDPDLNNFIRYLDVYRRISASIKLHTDPLHVFSERMRRITTIYMILLTWTVLRLAFHPI